MTYGVENGLWRSVFAAPTELVDSHLKLCGEAALKVLLAVLRYGGGLDENALSAVTGKTVPVVRDALDYLLSEGLLKTEEQGGDAPEHPRPQAEPKPRRVVTVTGERQKLSREDIIMMAEDDEAVTFLLQEAQQVLGKTLGSAATETVVSLYAHYGMQPDVILMVLQYCKGIDRANMPYIEKVAASWVENGITTHEQAEAEIQRLNKAHSAEGRIKSAFGIADRALVSNERKYIPVWLEEFGFDIPMIHLAYERCVETKGKLSFPYINGILANWHKNGVNTPRDALKNMSEESRKRAEAKNAASYDMNEIEKMLDAVTF